MSAGKVFAASSTSRPSSPLPVRSLHPSKRAGRFLEWKVRIFAVGAVLALVGMYRDERWMTGLAIVVLVGGLVIRVVLERDSGPVDPDDADPDEADPDQASSDAGEAREEPSEFGIDDPTDAERRRD